MNRDKIKKFMLIPKLFHFINRKRLKNKDFTLLTPNCFGGIIYNCLGLKFTSPTINLRFDTVWEFYLFCSRLDEYLQKKLVEIPSNNVYPMAMLGDLTLHLVHYKTFKDAEEKWESRKKRMNFDNICIISNDWVNEDTYLDDEIIIKFSELNCRNVVILTQNKKNIPNTYYLGRRKLRNLMKTNALTGLRGFELTFDYVNFLNGKKCAKA